jgi:hypothetical protein
MVLDFLEEGGSQFHNKWYNMVPGDHHLLRIFINVVV